MVSGQPKHSTPYNSLRSPQRLVSNKPFYDQQTPILRKHGYSILNPTSNTSSSSIQNLSSYMSRNHIYTPILNSSGSEISSSSGSSDGYGPINCISEDSLYVNSPSSSRIFRQCVDPGTFELQHDSSDMIPTSNTIYDISFPSCSEPSFHVPETPCNTPNVSKDVACIEIFQSSNQFNNIEEKLQLPTATRKQEHIMKERDRRYSFTIITYVS